MPTLDDCYPWQPGGCEWTIRFLWRWMSWFGRLDNIVFALMLVYLLAVVIHVYCRYYLARRVRGIDSTCTRALAAVLRIEVGTLESIAITAPYFGLAGTCNGFLNAFSEASGAKQAVMVLISTRIAVALLTTAAAIPVAVLATCSYNFLCIRIDSLGGEGFVEGQQRDRHFRGVHRFSPTKRFSQLPAFGLLAAPALALAIAGFMTFASFHTPTGFYVELASTRCEEHDVVDRVIVLHVTETGKLFLNQEQEDWNNLADRMSQIYSLREHRTLYLSADAGVSFQTVADALDTVENAQVKAGIQANGMRRGKLLVNVRLLTPKAVNAGCLIRVMSGSGREALR